MTVRTHACQDVQADGPQRRYADHPRRQRKFFPSQIETVLLNHGYPANYQIIVDRVKNSDTLDVQVEMTNEMFADTVKGVSAREKELVDGLRAMLGLAANVHLVSPKTIERSEGKAKRVIDKRKF